LIIKNLFEGFSSSEKAIYSALLMSIFLLPFGRAVEIPTALLALIGVGLLCKPASRGVLASPPVRLYAALFILLWLPMILSVIGGQDSTRSLEKSLLYLRFLFAGLAILYLLKKPAAQEAILYGSCFIVGVWLADSILQLVNGVDILGIQYDGQRLNGPFKRLIMPVFLSLLLPFCLYVVAKYRQRMVFIGVAAVSFFVLLLSGSRASLMVVLFGLALFFSFLLLQDLKKHMRFVLLVFALSTAVACVCYDKNESFNQRVDNTAMIFKGDYDSINRATSSRLPIWQAAWQAAINNPVNGVGSRNFRHVFHDYKLDESAFAGRTVTHPHLFILETFAETGLLGLVGLLFMPIMLLRFFIRQQKPISLVPYDQAVAAITIMVAFFPFNSHVSLYGSIYSQLAWLMTALSCSFLVSKREQRCAL
tara:strand:- start:1022 stop:2284 length:1263 start_codon:yes stop_codon:yes gene_type:complete